MKETKAVLKEIYSLSGVGWACQVTDTVEAYSLGNNESKSVAKMKYKRYGHGCCAHGGRLFVCGGRDGKT